MTRLHTSRKVDIQGLASQVVHVHSCLVVWRTLPSFPHNGADVVDAMIRNLMGEDSGRCVVDALRDGPLPYTVREQLEVFADLGLWDGSRSRADRPRARSRLWPGETMQIREYVVQTQGLGAQPPPGVETVQELRQYKMWLKPVRKLAKRTGAWGYASRRQLPLQPVRVEGLPEPLDPRHTQPRRRLLGKPSIEPAARFSTSLPQAHVTTLQELVFAATSDPLNRFLAYLWAYTFSEPRGAVLPTIARKLHAFRVQRHWFDVHLPSTPHTLIQLPTYP